MVSLTQSILHRYFFFLFQHQVVSVSFLFFKCERLFPFLCLRWVTLCPNWNSLCIEYRGVKSVCIKTKLFCYYFSSYYYFAKSRHPMCWWDQTFLCPLYFNFLYKYNTTIQSCNVVWVGVRRVCLLCSPSIYTFFFSFHSLFSNCSASPCQSCSSGSCSSRSWYVSQEAGGVRLWR